MHVKLKIFFKIYMANYFYYWTKNTAVLKIYMGFDGRDTPILTFSKSKKYLKIFSPSFNIAIKQNIISWDIYRSVSPMQKHVNCGAFGSVDKITCHILFKKKQNSINKKIKYNKKTLNPFRCFLIFLRMNHSWKEGTVFGSIVGIEK